MWTGSAVRDRRGGGGRGTVTGWVLVGGCLASGKVGLVGAVIGNWLASTLVLPEPLTITRHGGQSPLVWPVMGSAISVAVIGVLTGKRRR